MSSRLERVLRRPVFYARRALKLAVKRITPLFRNTAFFLQGQMDIHPASLWHDPDFVAETGGFYPGGDSGNRQIRPLEAYDQVRRDMLILLLRRVIETEIPGDFAELGVYRGRTARLIHHYAPERTLHLFDTFRGFAEDDVAQDPSSGNGVRPGKFGDTSPEEVQEFVSPRREAALVTHVGRFPDSIPDELEDGRFAFVHLDADLYEPVRSGLDWFYPRLSPGGVLVIHDYNAWTGARTAVDDFCQDRDILPVPMPDKSGSAILARRL